MEHRENNQEKITKTLKNQVEAEEISKKYSLYDLLFISFISIIIFGSVALMYISKNFVNFLKTKQSNYYFPTAYDINFWSIIMTIIILIPKLLFEKIIYTFTEPFLLEKYFKPNFQHEKEKAKRKISIYLVKFLHYFSLTIISYFYIYKKMDFFPKELGGSSDLKKMYSKGIKSFHFFDRPYGFDIFYIFNLSYTYADLICVLLIYDGQTDFLVMMFHHFCTISLILFSYYNHFSSIGSLFLFLHNISDVVVYFCRSTIYIKIPGIVKKIEGPLLLFCFIYFRQYVLGKIIYTYFKELTWDTNIIKNLFGIFAICLYILHLDWTYKLIRLAYNAVFKGRYNDSREFTKDDKKSA